MSFDRANYINQPAALNFELKQLFRQDDKLVIFEIGACEGEDSVKYSRLFPLSHIYTFEPLPANIALIKKNFEEYRVQNASYFNIALSNKNGEAEFYVSSGRPEGVSDTDWDFGNKSSSLLSPEKHLDTAPFIKFQEKILVETVTLKTFCAAQNIRGVDFIHMDVQGAELMVLEGAGDFISSIKSIWLEVSKVNFYKNQPLVDDVARFMKKNNFVLLKNAVNGIQGDQLYVSANHFSGFSIFRLKQIIRVRSALVRLMQLLRLKE